MTSVDRKLWWQRPWAIVGCAFAVRILAMAARYGWPGKLSLRTFPFYSELSRIAQSICTGQGYSSPFGSPTGPTAAATPAYPYLLAGIYEIFGVRTLASSVAALTVNCFFSALTCWFVYRLGRESFDETTGITAAWVWALYPTSVFFAVARIWETSLSVMLGVLMMLVAVEVERRPSPWRWAALGLTVAVAGLTNPSLVGGAALLGLWLIWRFQKKEASWVAGAALAAIVFAAVVAPWFVRNWEVFHAVIPFRSNGGMELRLGNGPETNVRLRDWLHPTGNAAERAKIARVGEIAYMKDCKRDALDYIKSHPGTFALQTIRRIVYTWIGFWSLRPSYLREFPGDAWNMLPFTLTTVLGAAGLVLAFRQGNPDAWAYSAMLFALPLSYYVTHVQPRYRHPLEPFLFILGSYAILEHCRRRREISARQRA